MSSGERRQAVAGIAPEHRLLVTRHFLITHLPKTGGTFLAGLCREHLPSDWIVETPLGKHVSHDELPDALKQLPAICFVRNPWDWYVSWYHFRHENPPSEGLPGTALWASAFDHGNASFEQAVTAACTGEGFDHPSTVMMRRRDVDHYTATYTAKAGRAIEAGRLEAGRFESLRQDFLDFLDRHSVPVGPGFRDAVMTSAPRNISERDDYRSYYDDELRDLVGYKAREIVRAYDYEF